MAKNQRNSRNNNNSNTNIGQNIQTQQMDIEKIAVLNYLELIEKEYEFERSKKESFENRVGLILALLGAIIIFVFEQVSIREIMDLAEIQINFKQMIQILVGLGTYVSFIYTILKMYKVIQVVEHKTFPVEEINEVRMAKERISETARLTLMYRDIVKDHRRLNNLRAQQFEKGLRGLIVSIICIGIYVCVK